MSNPVVVDADAHAPQMSLHDAASTAYQVNTQLESPSAMLTDTGLAQCEDLTTTLKQARLEKYEAALRELGCTTASDLGDVEESDMTEIGMKKIEIKRLQRLQ